MAEAAPRAARENDVGFEHIQVKTSDPECTINLRHGGNGPPALLHSLVERDDITAADLSSLDEVWTGGADCPEHLRERFAAKFGQQVHATYGLSEAPSVVAIDPRDGERGAVQRVHVLGVRPGGTPKLDVRAPRLKVAAVRAR